MSRRSERERAHFDALADDVGTVWWGSVTPAGRQRLQQRAHLAIQRAHLAPGVRVLEPGAGNGEFTREIAGSGATLIGIDIAPRQVELAAEQLRTLGNVRIVAGDIEERLDFPSHHFDAVVGNSVLHHVDLDRALPELFRVLKPGGCFFFFEPNMLNPQIALERNVGFIGRRLMNSPDETAFFRWRLRARLVAAGFRQIEVRPFDFLHPGTPARLIPVVSRVSRALGWVPLAREIAGSLQVYAER